MNEKELWTQIYSAYEQDAQTLTTGETRDVPFAASDPEASAEERAALLDNLGVVALDDRQLDRPALFAGVDRLRERERRLRVAELRRRALERLAEHLREARGLQRRRGVDEEHQRPRLDHRLVAQDRLDLLHEPAHPLPGGAHLQPVERAGQQRLLGHRLWR